MKIKIKQAVIVEGKYDKIKLESIIEALIIETNGFEIFRNREKLELIKKLAETRGLLILTDSDAAGFKIRSYLSGTIQSDRIVHAYIPDIMGKEKRKTVSSKEGKLGVEGIPKEILMDSLSRAGVMYEEITPKSRHIANIDLFENGLSGKPFSRCFKRKLLESLGLPERLSTNSLIKVLNAIMSYEEFLEAVENISHCK